MIKSIFDGFSFERDKIIILYQDEDIELNKEQIGEILEEIFAWYGWGIMDESSFSALKEVICDELTESPIEFPVYSGKILISDVDAKRLSEQIIEKLKK